MTLGEFWKDWITKHPEADDMSHFELVAAAYGAGLHYAFSVTRKVFAK